MKALLAILIFAPICAFAEVGLDDLPADELLRNLVLQQEHARDSLGSLTYKIHGVREDQAGGRKLDFSGIVKAKGPWRYAEWLPMSTGQVHSLPMERPGTVRTPVVTTQPHRRRIRAVLNDAYVAVMIEGTGSVNQYEYETPSQMSVDARAQATTTLPRDPLLYAFGNGTRFLHQVLSTNRDRSHYAVVNQVDPMGKKVFLIRVYGPKDSLNAPPRWEYELHPEYDYAITHFVMNANGIPAVEQWIEYQPVGNPVRWFPKRIKERDSKAGTLVTSVNTEIDPPSLAPLSWDDFTIDALKVPPKYSINKKSASGAITHLVNKDGVWIPADLLPPMIVRRGADSHSSNQWRLAILVGLGLVTLSGAIIWKRKLADRG